MESKPRMLPLFRQVWIYPLAFACVWVSVEVARAIGGVGGAVVGGICCLVLGPGLVLAGLLVSAWLAARRERKRAREGG